LIRRPSYSLLEFLEIIYTPGMIGVSDWLKLLLVVNIERGLSKIQTSRFLPSQAGQDTGWTYCCNYTATLRNVLTNYMERSLSWEANSRSASQEIPRLLWNPEVNYCADKSPPLIPVLSQMHSVHTLPNYFFKIHSNIILPFTPRSSEWSLPFRVSEKNFLYISRLPHASYTTRPSNSPHGHSYICLMIIITGPDRLWGPPSLLSNGYHGLFSWGEAAGAW